MSSKYYPRYIFLITIIYGLLNFYTHSIVPHNPFAKTIFDNISLMSVIHLNEIVKKYMNGILYMILIGAINGIFFTYITVNNIVAFLVSTALLLIIHSNHLIGFLSCSDIFLMGNMSFWYVSLWLICNNSKYLWMLFYCLGLFFFPLGIIPFAFLIARRFNNIFLVSVGYVISILIAWIVWPQSFEIDKIGQSITCGLLNSGILYLVPIIPIGFLLHKNDSSFREIWVVMLLLGIEIAIIYGNTEYKFLVIFLRPLVWICVGRIVADLIDFFYNKHYISEENKIFSN